MRAIVLDRYGRPEQVMRLAELPRPVPGPGEVAVRVAAVSLNSWDVDLVIGAALIRIAAPFRPKHRVIGSDVSGTVIAVGPEVTRHSIGDTVFGELSASGWGGFAEVVTAREDALVPKPADLDDLTAAALPQAGSMAFQALGGADATAAGGTLEGRRVLIVGAGGGVGTFAIQLAKLGGAHVTAIERAASKLDRLAELGADAVGDEIVEPETSAAQRFDVILDVVGALPPTRARELLAPGGLATYIGGSPRRILQVVRSGAKHGDSGGRVRLLAAVPNRDLPALAVLAASGALRAIVDGPHPLDEAPHQVERLRSGEVFGKVVIVP
jgi:NADPH:quinone reductase-like Zn-dependent oxidoreductase